MNNDQYRMIFGWCCAMRGWIHNRPVDEVAEEAMYDLGWFEADPAHRDQVKQMLLEAYRDITKHHPVRQNHGTAIRERVMADEVVRQGATKERRHDTRTARQKRSQEKNNTQSDSDLSGRQQPVRSKA